MKRTTALAVITLVFALIYGCALFFAVSEEHIITERCDIYYKKGAFGKPVSRERLGYLASRADEDWALICGAFGFETGGFRPVIVICSDKETLKSEMGSVSAVGAYYGKTVYVTAPMVWTSEPLAHELTHLAVDIKTGGNYSRWLTEGAALYYEKKITGVEWRPDLKGAKDAYGLNELEEACKSKNPKEAAFAYRAAYENVAEYIVLSGEPALQELLEYLGEGAELAVVLEVAFEN